MAEKATKLKQRKMKEKQGNEHEGEEKCYLRWNIQMDRSLAEILREECQMVHKGDGGWKSVAYNTAAAILSAQYNIEVSADNIKNRVKTWKRFYAVVSDILSQSGFSWDATKKMITIDEENVWNEYVKSQEDARTFRYKVIANWDDIVDLCGKDRATGEGAETCSEAAEVMTLIANRIILLTWVLILKVLRILTLMMSHPILAVQRKEINHLLKFAHQRKEVLLMFLLI
ncbi:hypothetical protein PRUPE_4G256700 [Prunus persica]|uniref:Myb/SANT-like domain-containing protein n=1 Tax=Prunus persica TaxID=3760 RepID=A0A251PR03_PRUPE|nr:hypothetical protein PRUPE_4G256700 [Prunus persica]